MPNQHNLGSSLALAFAAIFWGATFTFQREAMDHMSPMAFTGLRFLLGTFALLPFVLRRGLTSADTLDHPAATFRFRLGGVLASGVLIFAGISFQQYGLVWTTAGKAGFITGLYVVLVPLYMLLAGRRIMFGEGIGALLAVAGLYLLSFTGGFALAPGDGFVLAGSFVWAAHVLCLAHFSPKMDPLLLAAGQAGICAVLALACAMILGEWPSWQAVSDSWICLLWGGILSVALGYTLQVVGQRRASPTATAIILQFEAVVAALTGWLLLDEIMTSRMIAGGAAMLAGALLSQLWPILTARQTGRRPDIPDRA